MKKLLLFLFIALQTLNQGIASQEKTEEPSLAGIWRLHVPIGKAGDDTTKPKLAPTGLHKLIYENGKFTNLAVTSTATCITAYGTYDILSSSQYVEHIEKSFYSAYTGTDNVIAFEFRDADCLILSFSSPDEPGIIREIWCRVKVLRPHPVEKTDHTGL
ncbi:MAG: DUF4488 domain-containing protein [Prevotella sp.]|jgi:hypothetical protein|nr:DUF4488 domain-containing protein [Prevotella sp.]